MQLMNPKNESLSTIFFKVWHRNHTNCSLV